VARGAIVVITVAGVYDDLRGLRAPGKLALELLAALLAIGGGLGIAGMTSPLTGGYVEFGAGAAVITLFWILFITNAFNLIDGLDGLAAGVGVIASAMLLVIALAQGRLETVPVWSALGGALAGFLAWNFPPASIFLGDTGSLLTGFLVAVLAIESVAKGPAAIVVLAPVIVLGLPIVDVVLAVVRRTLSAGPRAVVRRDREHVHHRIVRAGLSMRDAVLVLYAACAGAGALAVAAVWLQGMAGGLFLAVTIAAVWIGVRLLPPLRRPR
jgi:UDP-GlcNAc:undecaprenyl-phosphate GlcNAc-1-phosphate transferase